MLEPDRHLPAHRRLPVHRTLTGLQCGDVQCTSGSALEARTVEEDARGDPLVVDQPGDRGRIPVAVRIAGAQIPLLARLRPELHVAWLESRRVPFEVGDVLVVD